MGYETKLIIGKASQASPEWALSDQLYKDGSGFEPLRDAKGNILHTGRTEHWFQIMAMVDLCKLGHADDSLNRLLHQSHKTAKEQNKAHVYYFYDSDGNTQVKEDRYGDGMWPVPIKDVLDAMKASEGAQTYRRLVWAIALLEAMVKDSENLQVLFYGY
jgi:hypothetical protein